MLHKIRTQGIEAYCSDLIVDRETNHYISFLGVGGFQSTVKGILANMLKGESLSVDIKKETCWVERFSTNYLMRIKKMPSEYCHGITLIKIGTDQEDLSRLYLLIGFLRADARGVGHDHLLSDPLHPALSRRFGGSTKDEGVTIENKTLLSFDDCYGDG